MQNLNKIPSVGTFGEVARNANTNFSLLKMAIDLLEHNSQHAKGYFTSATELNSAYPAPAVGDWAVVVVSGSLVIYQCSTSGTWANTGTPWAGGAIDLAEYLKKGDGENVVNSLGVDLSEEVTDFTVANYVILANGKFHNTSSLKHAYMQVSEGEVYYLIGESSACRYAFATSASFSSGGNIPLVSGTTVQTMSVPNTYYKVTIPPGCLYLLFNAEGQYATRCFRLGTSVQNKLIKLVAITESQAELNIGDIYYNSRSDIKQIRMKTGTGANYVVIPFYDGAIYTYEDQLYLWNGTDLVPTGPRNMKQYVFSGSVEKLSESDVRIRALGVRDSNGYTRTVYADPANQTAVTYHISGTVRFIVLTDNDEIVIRTTANSVLLTDYVLLVYSNGKMTGGALLPIMSESPIGERTPYVTDSLIINTNGKLAKSSDPNTIYFIPVTKGDIVQVSASDENPTNFRSGFTDEYPASGQTLQVFKDHPTGDIYYQATAPVTGYFIVFHVSTRYADMVLSVIQQPKIPLTVSTSNASAYHSDGSIYIYDLYLTYEGEGGQRNIQIRDTIQPLQSTFCYVLTENDEVVAKLSADMLPTDVLLLRLSVSGTTVNYFGGLLYTDYCKKSMSSANNPFEGKKVVCTGGSSMEGYTVSGGPKASEIIGTKLGMTSINYAIAGSAIAKHQPIVGYQAVYENVFFRNSDWQEAVRTGTVNTAKNYMVKDSDKAPMYHIYSYINGNWTVRDPADFIDSSPYVAHYDDIFVRQSDFDAAIDEGTLNTSKTYLVKDSATRPWYHLYKYSNGSWARFLTGDSSIDNAKAPLVDRIREMDTDADVIILDSGGNDWAHAWVPMGDDFSRDKTTFCGAMHLLCQYLVDTYPGKVILWTSRPAAWRYSDAARTPDIKYDNFYTRRDAPNAMGYTNLDYVENQKMILRQYGIQYFDLGGKLCLSQQNLWWCGDPANGGFYAHPGAQAQELIADAIIREVMSYRL